LAGFEAFRISALVNIGGSLFQSVAVCLGAWHGGVKGAIIGMTASTLVIVIMTRYALRVEMWRFGVQNWWREAWAEWPVLVGFSLPAFLTTMIAGPVFWACNALLANQTNGYAELGIYNAANQWYAAVSFLPNLLTTAALPVLSERYGVNDWHGSAKIVRALVRLTICVAVPIVMILCLLSPLIMRGYGDTFVTGRMVLVLAVATAGIHVVVTPYWFFIMASGKMWTCFIMNLGCSLVTLVISVLVIRHGAVGLASARLVAYVLHAVWIVVYVSFMFRLNESQGEVVACK
jgi:O-antigen/teichoic acid export membrane protein